MAQYIEFTPEQKERAATVDLEEFLLRQGEKLIKSGREKRLASDHSVTVRGYEWFDHASNEGGRAVSFVQKYYGKSYVEAMSMLLGESMEPFYPQAKKQEPTEQKPFAPPVPNANMHRVFAYLLKTRGLDADVVSYNVFILWYSVAPHCFPQQIREVAAAVDLIHRNAESWNCDENHIAIMGFSAGGHLATHYSTNFDCAEVRSVFPESYPVAASILCYPVITADPAYTHLESIENVSGHEPITQEDVKRFSCELLVTEQTPPAYIWHTAEDQSVPAYNSFLYARALSEKHIPFEFHVFPFGAHGLATCDEQTNDGEITARIAHNQRWIEESQQWLKLLWANH